MVKLYLDPLSADKDRRSPCSHLANASLYKATLPKVKLTGANLTGADLTSADLVDVNLVNALQNSIHIFCSISHRLYYILAF